MADDIAAAEFDVLVFGLIGVEYLLEIDVPTRQGVTGRIRRELRCAGGSGALCAATLARWGARVALMGNPLGDDPNGRFATSQLAGLPNLEICTPILSDFETPYTITMHAPEGEPSVLSSHGAVERYAKNTQGETQWPDARLVFCDSEFGTQEEGLVRHCAKHGVPLIVKGLAAPVTAPVSGVIATLPAGVDFAGVRRRVGQLAGQWNTLLIALERHRYRGVWSQAGERTEAFSLSCSGCQPSGALGLEEVFRAGLVWGRLRDWDWDDSLNFAIAAAGQKARGGAGLEGIPERSAVEAARGQVAKSMR